MSKLSDSGTTGTTSTSGSSLGMSLKSIGVIRVVSKSSGIFYSSLTIFLVTSGSILHLLKNVNRLVLRESTFGINSLSKILNSSSDEISEFFSLLELELKQVLFLEKHNDLSNLYS